MDVRTVAKILQEVNRLIPDEISDQIADGIEFAVKKLDEFGEALDEATDQSSRQNRQDIWDAATDKPKSESQQVSFEDVIGAWDTPSPKDNAAEQPVRETGGSEVPSISDITSSIYRFMTNYDEDYAPFNPVYEDWNRAHPTYVVIDYLKFLAEQELVGMEDETE